VAWRAIESGREALPFLAAIALFLLGYLGLLISNFPYIVPPSRDSLPERPSQATGASSAGECFLTDQWMTNTWSVGNLSESSFGFPFSIKIRS
jgi:cytochrome bd-type quinol oxidase subunit 2